MRQSNEIDRQAAEWAARSDVEELPVEQQAAFDAWLAADIRHVGAYAKATAVLARIERSRAIGLQFAASRRRADFMPSRRIFVLAGSIAASLTAVAFVADFGWKYLHEDIYSTNIGATEVVPLSDGSVVTLNTDSKVIVRYTNARRTITLVRGEALFDVAKNKNRPFVVEARNAQLRAVGTSFAVRLFSDEPVQLLVREGVVEIDRPNMPAAVPTRVAANTRAVISTASAIVIAAVAPSKLAGDLAWKAGRVYFDDETLASAAREFARYSNTRIVIDDPWVANRTVTGLYVSNDPVGFALAVAVSLDLRAEVGNEEVRLTRKKQAMNAP